MPTPDDLERLARLAEDKAKDQGTRHGARPRPSQLPADSQAPPSDGGIYRANPFDGDTLTRKTRAEMARHGDVLLDAPPQGGVSEDERAGYAEPPWWRTAMGMVKVIGALTLAIPATAAATTTTVVSIINALRQPTDPKLREDVEATKKELTALRSFLAEKDTARALELEKRFDGLGSRLTDLDIRYPAPKVDPRRSPRRDP
jgi:hypothetical protein